MSLINLASFRLECVKVFDELPWTLTKLLLSGLEVVVVVVALKGELMLVDEVWPANDGYLFFLFCKRYWK